MPKRNYGFEKRQKELEKKQKKELKLQKRLERAANPQPEDGEGSAAVLEPPPEG